MIHFPFQPAISISLDAAILEQDFQNARQIDAISLGEACIFYPGMLKLRYLPYDQIQWAYLQAEENLMATCCRRAFVDIWYLLLYADGKQAAKIEFQKKETAKAALASLKDHNPNIMIGYNEENKVAFAVCCQ